MERNYIAHSDVLANRGVGNEANVLISAHEVEDAVKPRQQHPTQKNGA